MRVVWGIKREVACFLEKEMAGKGQDVMSYHLSTYASAAAVDQYSLGAKEGLENI